MIGKTRFSGHVARLLLLFCTILAMTNSAAWGNSMGIVGKAKPVWSGIVTGSGMYEFGSTATLLATPNDGFSFDGWYDGWFEKKTKIHSDPVYSFTVTEPRATLEARFIPNTPSTFQITANAYMVVIATGGGLYEQGAPVTLEATPADLFDGWYENGEKVHSEAVYSFTATANRTLTALHRQDLGFYTRIVPVTVNAGFGGKVTDGSFYGNGVIELAYPTSGYTDTLLATPDLGYSFDGWYVNGVKVHEETVYCFHADEFSHQTLEARFTKDDKSGGGCSAGMGILFSLALTALFVLNPRFRATLK